MAKAPTTKADPKAARKAAAYQNTANNQARRLAKHVKAHPKDEQAAKAVGKPRAVRKAPRVRGNFRTVNKAYRDAAGHVLEAPLFRVLPKEA